MSDSITIAQPTQEDLVGVGKAIGRRESFALVAGRCSAAEADQLRDLRDSKKYRAVTATWDEFCTKYLGISKSNADRIIRLLDKFGPGFFELSNLTRISPETYSAIAPSLDEEGLRWNGEAIALLPENAEKLTAAVADMRKSVPPQPETPVSHEQLFRCLEKRCKQVLDDFTRLAETGQESGDREQLLELLQSSCRGLMQIKLRITT